MTLTDKKSLRTGFQVAYGRDKHTCYGAMAFEEAKTEGEARKLFKTYVKNTYPWEPANMKICYVVPLSEISTEIPAKRP